MDLAEFGGRPTGPNPLGYGPAVLNVTVQYAYRRQQKKTMQTVACCERLCTLQRVKRSSGDGALSVDK